MKKIAILLITVFLASCSTAVVNTGSSASSSTQKEFDKEVTVKVSGAVCGFCSYGIRKKISALSFVDTSRYENGILTNSEEQSVTIAVLPEGRVDEEVIRSIVIEAGYETISIDYNY